MKWEFKKLECADRKELDNIEFSELNDLLDFLENEWIGVAKIYEGIWTFPFWVQHLYYNQMDAIVV